jgi:hypothetical protein
MLVHTVRKLSKQTKHVNILANRSCQSIEMIELASEVLMSPTFEALMTPAFEALVTPAFEALIAP